MRPFISILIILAVSPVWGGKKPTHKPRRINFVNPTPAYMVRSVKGVEFKKIAKPDESERLRWERIVVGEETIDGATLMGVPNDSMWNRLGLRDGDVIVKIDEQEIMSPKDFEDALQRVDGKMKSNINFEVLRDDQKFLIDYKLTW